MTITKNPTQPILAFLSGVLITLAVVNNSEPYHKPENLPVLETRWEVCFTPSKTCQSQIISNILSAKKTILVQAYSFTDKEIIQAITQAKQNGVDVKVILDKSNRSDRYSQLSELQNQEIPVMIDAPSGIAHNKVIIIDGEKVITGSYNFSNAAYKKNTENVLILSDKSLAQEYTKNWLYRWSLSTP